MQNKTICLNAQTWENEHISLSQKLWHKCKKSYPLYPSNMYLLVNLYILILILSSKVEPSAFKYQYWPCSFHSVCKCFAEQNHVYMNTWMQTWENKNLSLSKTLAWVQDIISSTFLCLRQRWVEPSAFKYLFAFCYECWRSWKHSYTQRWIKPSAFKYLLDLFWVLMKLKTF